jgi:ribulose-phosphate 3-epimerase
MIESPARLLAPSLLSADFCTMADAIRTINTSGADWLHVDVMDGRFVPNFTFGMPAVASMKKYAQLPLDVHLMMVEPEKYIDAFAKAGADIITVHAEACAHLHRTIQQIKQTGAKAGVALNPHTPIDVLRYILSDLDLVLLMSVNPGFGGQHFIQATFQKIDDLNILINQTLPPNHAKPLIEIDGGVGMHNAAELWHAGANVLVAGNALFSSGDLSQNIQQLKQKAK